MTQDGGRAGESGQGYVFLLVIFMILLTGLGVNFVGLMNIRQHFAGDQYRISAARYVAEAGVEKVIWYLEGRAPDGSENASWRPSGYSEEVQAAAVPAQFTVSVRNLPGGLVAIWSRGEAGGTQRGVRVVAKIAPRALDYPLFAAGLAVVEGERAGLSLAGPGGEHCFPRVLADVHGELWFRTPGISLDLGPACTQQEPVLQLGLENSDRLTVGEPHEPAPDVARLQRFRLNIAHPEQVTIRRVPSETLPIVDVEGLRRRAVLNTANEELNAAAGWAEGDATLQEKRDSLYAPQDFSALLQYLRARPVPLVGPIFVTGPTSLPSDAPVTVVNGYLATDGGLTISPGGSLTVRHDLRSRLLPGLVALNRQAYAPIEIGSGAHVDIAGAVVAESALEVHDGATLEVAGAVIAIDPIFSLRLENGTLTVRYDPAVRGTADILPGAGRRRVVPVSWLEFQ